MWSPWMVLRFGGFRMLLPPMAPYNVADLAKDGYAKPALSCLGVATGDRLRHPVREDGEAPLVLAH